MSSDALKKVHVVCPVCSSSKFIPVPPSIIQTSEGLTTINVPPNMVCPHSFLLYIDQNMQIRGYQKTDFEIKVSEETNANPSRLAEDALEFLNRFGIETAALLIEAVITVAPVVIIYRDKGLADTIGQVFPEITKCLHVISHEEWNQTWRNRVYGKDFIRAFVFDWEMAAVIKAPDRKAKTKFGHMVFEELKKIHGQEAQMVIITNWAKRVLLYADVATSLVDKNPKIKRGDITKFLKDVHEYDEKRVPFDIIVRRLIQTKGNKFDNLQ